MSSWRTGSLDPEVFERLAEGLAGSELQSMLLEEGAGARTPATCWRSTGAITQFRKTTQIAPRSSRLSA